MLRRPLEPFVFSTIVIGGPPEVARIVARSCGRLGIAVPGRDAEGDLEAVDGAASPAEGDAAADAKAAIHPGGATGEELRDLVRIAAETGAPFLGCDPEVTSRLTDAEGFRALVEEAGLARGYDDVDERLAEAHRIEVVVARDGLGQALVLGDRETSIGDARGARAWLRECPAPHLTFLGEGEALGGALGDAALRLADAAGLRGVAVFELAVDRYERFHCLGARTGMEVAQADLEMVFGVDLVEAELRCFTDAGLPEELEQVRPSGACVSIDLRATTPGTLEELRFPPAPSSRVRIDPVVAVGDTVAPGRLVSLTAHGPVRHRAVHLLDRVLSETVVGPVSTNLRRVRRALDDASFRAGQYDVGFVERLVGGANGG